MGTSLDLGILWLLLVVTSVGCLAGLSQLGFLLTLSEQSTRDALTGFLLRRFGEEVLASLFNLAERSDMPLAVLFVDLDNFKQVNDKFGHGAGDETLEHAADALRSVLRSQDVVARWGGEEFLVLLPNTDATNARRVVCRLATSGLGLRPDGLLLRASIGIAERIADGPGSSEQLVELADKRMYAAKRAGRNRCVGCDDLAIPFICESEDAESPDDRLVA